MKIAIYPGSFDPPTKGHEDIAQRALQIFDKVIIAVGDNRSKNVLFSIEERVLLWKEILANNPQVEILSFRGLIVDFAKEQKANIIVRGLRAISDFEYELQIAETNRSLYPDIDTVFFTAKGRQLFVSSTIVKEIASLGGDVSDKAPPNVCKALLKKFF
ncbi:MAG: pantetheine-phosphate adenylyltransferase [Brevinema sp.]